MKEDYFFITLFIAIIVLLFSLTLSLAGNERQYQSCLTYAIEHKMTIEDKIKVCG